MAGVTSTFVDLMVPDGSAARRHPGHHLGALARQHPQSQTRPSAHYAERVTERDSENTRAVIYARVSQDAGGQGLAVSRQIKECQELIANKGWVLAADPYQDNDISATRSKLRPAYERLLADIAAGLVDAVVVWALDRLHRRPIELEQFIDLTDLHRVRLANVAGQVDLAADSGRMQARIMGAVARYEAEALGRRQRSKQQQLREAGMPFGGGKRCFGWMPDRMTSIPEEHEEIRHMVRWVLDGRSLNSLAVDLNARRVPTVSQWAERNPSPRRTKPPAPGKPWHVTTLRSLLSRPRIAGLMTWKGDVVGDGRWDAVIDRPTFDRLQWALDARPGADRRPNTARKNWLSGIAVCGLCGTPLQVGSQQTGKPELRRYRCPRSTSGAGGPRHGGRNMRHLDSCVLDGLLVMLDLMSLVDPGEPEEVWSDPLPEIERLRERLTWVADQYALDRMTGEQFLDMTATLRGRLAALEQKQRPPVGAHTLLEWYLGTADQTHAREAFLNLPLERRRAVLIEALGTGHIKVHAAEVLNRGLDTSTIDILWQHVPSNFVGVDETA